MPRLDKELKPDEMSALQEHFAAVMLSASLWGR